MTFEEQLLSLVPFNEQEAADREVALRCLHLPDIYVRDNELVHITASAWIVNADRSKALMAYHNIYDSWAWLGGHADGETDLLKVAEREAKEESGITDIKPVSKDILSLEIVPVSGHEKRGKYVPSHLHLNVTYLFEAPEHQELFIKPDENSGVMWIPLDEIKNKSTEKWFVERIYSKLIAKAK